MDRVLIADRTRLLSDNGLTALSRKELTWFRLLAESGA